MKLWDITIYLIVAAVLILILMSFYTWYLKRMLKEYEKDYAQHEMFDNFIEPKWR